MTWYGALSWAGRRALARDDLIDVPANARKCVAIGVASAAGYRRAVELLPAWFPDGPPMKRAVRRWCSLLVMRAAVEEKRFIPEFLRYLVPPTTAKFRADDVLKLAAAFRSAVRERHEGGTVFLLGAVLTTAFRSALASAMEKNRSPADAFPGWGHGGIGAERVSVLSPVLERLAAAQWSPWQEPIAKQIKNAVRVDLDGVEKQLMAMLGEAAPPAFWFVYLDDALLNATLFTLFGNTLSARVHLRVVNLSSRGLLHWMESASSGRNDTDSVWSHLEASLQGPGDAVADLLQTPDPTIVLGTPSWALNAGLGKIAPLALKDGRMKGLSAVRALLHRQELRERLEPFWILRKNEFRSVVNGLAWIGNGETHPSEPEWLEFLELLAEEALNPC